MLDLRADSPYHPDNEPLPEPTIMYIFSLLVVALGFTAFFGFWLWNLWCVWFQK